MARRRVTLADVSSAAGVGIATVSRALAAESHPDISAATRERVRAIADGLGYRPSAAARALRRGGYETISVIVHDDSWGWWEPVVRAAFDAARGRGYQTLVHPVTGAAGGAASIITGLENMPTEGAILCGFAGDASVRAAAEGVRLPVVAVDDAATDIVVPTVTVDSRQGARDAVGLLIAGGSSRIAYVGDEGEQQFASLRYAGYRDALAAAGIAYDPALVAHCRDALDESRSTLPEIDELLKDATIDGVFCEFDLLAAPLLRALHRLGRRVPDDVAVVGFDDERAAQLLHPMLTTVRQPYTELGRRAVDLLFDVTAGVHTVSQRELLTPTLVERETTRPRR